MTLRHAPEILEYAAFAAAPHGGNPAGVVLDAGALDDADMQRIAADVGHAETAFVVGRTGGDRPLIRIRYFSPVAEVPFCGHATIATAVAIAEREGDGDLHFETAAGEILIQTAKPTPDSRTVATFTSVPPRVRELGEPALDRLLALTGLTAADLDEAFPAAEAFAGNWHPVVVVRDEAVFDGFTFDPGAMRTLMDENGWTGTVAVLRATAAREFEARNLFPVGTMSEDPATGSAAAAVGGYLRERRLVDPPASIVIRQGRHVGRPSELLVDIPVAGGIRVSGGATPIER